MFSIKDRVFVVTGGAQGIGLNYVKGLAKAGARLAICDKQEDKVRSVEKDLKQQGYEIIADGVDVTNKLQIENFINKVVKCLSE